MTIDTSTGLIGWAPTATGDYNITVTVSDDGSPVLSESQSFTIHVGQALPVHNLTKNTYYSTIQAALDDADSDNSIEVADGTYDESITFPSSKKIILQSVNSTSSTTIRGIDSSTTVTFNGSPAGTTLGGFTIIHTGGDTGRGIDIISGGI